MPAQEIVSRVDWKRPFFTIWTGQAFSLLGSKVAQFALIWWLTELSGSATVLAMASLIGLIPEIISRYRSTYFNHIIGWYAAGYYGYIWSGVLDSDAFEAFKETSLFDKETADRFRKEILAKNGTADYRDMYVNFRGRDPEIEPLLKKRGLM